MDMNPEQRPDGGQDELRQLQVTYYATWLIPTWFIPLWPTVGRTPPSRRRLSGRRRSQAHTGRGR